MQNSTNTVLGILAGTAIGGLLGILFAPEKGSDTRRRIADQAAATRDSLAEGADHLKHKVVDNLSTKKDNLENRLEEVLSDTKYKAEDVIGQLEKKLSHLKAQTKNLKKA